MTSLALVLSVLLTQADAGETIKVVPVYVPEVGTGLLEPKDAGAPLAIPIRLLDGGFARGPDGGLLYPPGVTPPSPPAPPDAGRGLGPIVPLGTPDLLPAPLLLPDGGPLWGYGDGGLDAGVDAGEPEGEVTIHAGLEIAGMALPVPDGQLHGYASLSPILGLDAGDDFDGELGATFNLLVVDTDPSIRSGEIGKVLRKKDWDEGSDFGQIFRHIRIGREDSGLWVKLGAVRRKTLGAGHLIERYSNQDNIDYHPAALEVGVGYGPVTAEAFVSDLLGPRLYAGELAWDLGATFSNVADNAGRYHLAVSVAHDSAVAGAVGSLTPASARVVDLAQADLSAVLWRNERTRLLTVFGMGGRFKQVSDFGAALGAAMESTLGTVAVGGKLELRKQAGGYRQGFFGAGYELSRFSDIGFHGVSRALADFPDAFSLALDAHVAIAQAFTFTADAEFFTWGRSDVDLILAFAIPGGRAVGSARLTISGLGQDERFYATADLRFRFFENLYFVGSTGTAFSVRPDDSLTRGLVTTLGLGLDITR
ncbi:MAG: hypothetical protein K1X89_17995 [Myxococcaceae bacterium]|nr:hypothetical protein [Myxococcaceae bacterium]